MEWIGDSLGVYVPHQKNDQEGEKPRDPKHIYSNPLRPEVCPVLSLAVYLLTFPEIIKSGTFLFLGKLPYERYSKALAAFLKKTDVAAELKRRGLSATEIGSHSVRKGAASFVSNGSPGGPSQAAINLRVGWSMGQVQDTYIRYEQAGDMFVGRTVTGLPLGSPQFSILPPFFTQPQDDLVTACFPGAPPYTLRILHFCLASAIFHRRFLKETLPVKSALFASPLFTNFDLEALSAKVICRPPTLEDPITATGVPPHVDLLRSVSELKTEFARVAPAIDNVAPKVIAGVAQVIEDRAIQASAVTPQQLRTVVAEEMKPLCDLKAAVTHLQERLDSGASLAPQQSVAPPSLPLNHYASFPADYQIPVCSPSHAWILYNMGDVSRHFPPLRTVQARELPNRKVRQRMSDLRCLMSRLESSLKDQGHWIELPSLVQLNEMYEFAKPAIAVPQVAGQKRRREGQLFGRRLSRNSGWRPKPRPFLDSAAVFVHPVR